MDPIPLDELFARGRRIPLAGEPGIRKEHEPDDPYARVGVGFPVESAPEADREAARVFIEEYALTGWPAAAVRALFTDPEFLGPHGIYRRRGAGLVDELLAEVYGATGGGDG